MTSLLLLSSSTVHGRGYLDHAESELRDFFREAGEVLFLPFALHNVDAFSLRAGRRFASMGIRLVSLSAQDDPAAAIARADGFFVGGGNTFRLLKCVRERGWLTALRARVEAGAPYAGASAGTNLACPTIRTTNDMPIVQPDSFDALSLVPFQINPHYFDPDRSSTHQGETRADRIRQFHEETENARPVLAMREGAILKRRGARLDLLGHGGVRVFRPGEREIELLPEREISEYL